MQTKTPAQDYKVEFIKMDEILSDADFNCRGKIVPHDVLDLVQSIRESGLQQPIVVQAFTTPTMPNIKYRIVAGHRRHAALKVLKQEMAPVFVRNDLSELEARLFNLTENIKRKELNILQEARALIPFAKTGWTEEIIAAKTGTSRGWVQVRLMLLKLPEDIQALAAAGVLTQSQIRHIYSMGSDEDRYAAVRLIQDRREKGESVDVAPKKPLKPHEKRERKVTEIIALQDYIQEQCSNSIITRILGWAAGYVSQLEIHREIREYYKEQGENYVIPRDITDSM